ncbi:MAG: hypothetical protein HUU55_05050 [Myxococcales bacterium]|nr:hypothetical protein [Myxococcales bacterium]
MTVKPDPRSNEYTKSNQEDFWDLLRHRTRRTNADEFDTWLNKQCGVNPSQDDCKCPQELSDRMDGYERLRNYVMQFLSSQCGFTPALTTPNDPKPGDCMERPNPDQLHTSDANWRIGDDQVQNLTYLKEGSPFGTTLPHLDNVGRGMGLTGEGNTNEPLNSSTLSLAHQFTCPCWVELIWSYWHEQGMLVQSMFVVAARIQNIRIAGGTQIDRLNLAPLRPMANLLWGYVQKNYERLTVQRRAYEYDHQYGLRLMGKAIPTYTTADSRSRFLESFHGLLQTTLRFYIQLDNLQIREDAFPVLNALKDLHLVLAEGQHNQFGDLPYVARAEMLMEQWLLSRKEMIEFLGGRPMVPYTERWMGTVDTIKSNMGWNTPSSTFFNMLAKHAEVLLLSVRYGAWSNISNATEARNWAVFFRDDIQAYVHAYRTVTGVALEVTQPTDSTKRISDSYEQPAILMQRRLATSTSRVTADKR